MTDTVPVSANDLVESLLNDLLGKVEQAFDADALCIVGSLVDGIDGLIRTAVEERHGREGAGSRLVVILTTDGGFLETVKRIVYTIRHHYPDYVGFVVPDHAYSAGTALVMSGDQIFMDYYAHLGPTDPQTRSPKTGRLVPALGYLERYDELLKKADEGTITSAETVVMVDGFDQAELYQCKQGRELSIELVAEWLVEYKFKGWTKTETRQRRVTAKKRQDRAKDIAQMLSDPSRWHSHAHGIPMEVLRKELMLKIDDLDDVSTQSNSIKQYNQLLSDYMTKMGYSGMIHTTGRFEPIRFA